MSDIRCVSRDPPSLTCCQTGVFGTNVKVPHNGTDEDHTVNSDGSPAAYYVFGIVLIGVLIIIALVIGVVAWIFKASRKSFENGGAKRL